MAGDRVARDLTNASMSGNSLAALGWAVLGWAVLGWAVLGWAALGWAALGWAALGWAALGWAALGWAALGWAAATREHGSARLANRARPTTKAMRATTAKRKPHGCRWTEANACRSPRPIAERREPPGDCAWSTANAGRRAVGVGRASESMAATVSRVNCRFGCSFAAGLTLSLGGLRAAPKAGFRVGSGASLRAAWRATTVLRGGAGRCLRATSMAVMAGVGGSVGGKKRCWSEFCSVRR